MREIFPRGLFQPEGSYRFGQDALLLASWAALALKKRPQARMAAELGCGCGAAVLGLALACRNLSCLALEKDDALLAACERNARLLSLAGRVACARADFMQPDWCLPILHAKACCDLVLANPPWRRPGNGRKSASALRENALCAPEGTFEAFVDAALWLGRPDGLFCMILPARLLPDAVRALRQGFGLRRLLPLQARSGAPIRRLCLLARKGAADDLEILPPLALHASPCGSMPVSDAVSNGYTRQALDFCPWLEVE